MANDDEKFEHKYLDIWAKSSSPPSYFVDRHPTAVQCVKCNELEYIGSCPNCGNTTYQAGYDSDRIAGLFCVKCSKGRSRWTCKKCGTDNPMASTFGQLYPKGFCFIATATFESIDAPEVVFLREFRDITLLKNSMGKVFVELYYQYSPPIARILESSQVLRRSSRLVLSTLVWCLKHNWRR
jgi:hypothetical protein